MKYSSKSFLAVYSHTSPESHFLAHSPTLILPTRTLSRRLSIVTAIFEPAVRTTGPFNQPHQYGMFVVKSKSQVRFDRQLHSPRHVLKSLVSFLGAAVSLMISPGRFGWRRPALANLLDPCLKRQHGRLLIGLQMNIHLHTVDVLDTPLDEVAGVYLSRCTLSGACMAEE